MFLNKEALKRKKNARKGNQKDYQNNYPLHINPNKPWVEYFFFRNTNILKYIQKKKREECFNIFSNAILQKSIQKKNKKKDVRFAEE